MLIDLPLIQNPEYTLDDYRELFADDVKNMVNVQLAAMGVGPGMLESAMLSDAESGIYTTSESELDGEAADEVSTYSLQSLTLH